MAMAELVIRATDGDVPIWGSAQTIRDLFGVPSSALDRLVAQGQVATRKLPGDAKRATRVYKIQGQERSLEQYLEIGEGVE
jgi:hypothetical protein